MFLNTKTAGGFTSGHLGSVTHGELAVAITLAPKALKKLFPTDILFQTTFWGQVKARIGWEPRAFDIVAEDSRSDVLILNQPFGDNRLAAYIPQGPEYAPPPENYGVYLEELAEKLVPHLDSRTSFIRFDLPWLSPFVDNDFASSVIPEARVQEMRMNYGTCSWNFIKSVNDMTVASCMIVDIADEEKTLLARMKPKTRYNIGLAGRKGVRTFIAGMDSLPAFYELYLQTAGRNKFLVCDYDHFHALFSVFEQNNQEIEVVFILSCHNNDLLAGVIMVISGKTALFLFGASSDRKRNFMGSYAVHWEAIRQARLRGCSEYDMGGVSPGMTPNHPFYGLYCFKSGFGGRLIHRFGTWDFPLDKDAYTAFRNAETILCGLGGS